MEQILEEFKDKAINHGGIYLFETIDAIAVIERCRELEKRILGIDAFEISGQYIQPMDYSDYSDANYEDLDPDKYYQRFHIKQNIDTGHWEKAKQFIRDRANKGWVFEIVYK